MVKFWEATGRQLRHPHGLSGQVMGHLMCLINRPPNALAIEALDVRDTDYVLEIGFGPGCALKLLAKLARRGHVTGIDTSPTMFAQACGRNRRAILGGKMDLLTGSYDRLPLADHSVDRILAVNVAYFFGSNGMELAEMRRVLKPDGQLVVYVTSEKSMRNWKFASVTTHRIFDESKLRDLLGTGGFQNRKLTIVNLRIFPGIFGLLAKIV
jgi:ubiquinone/menaquinone biosynthesis C-methylase UbiE